MVSHIIRCARDIKRTSLVHDATTNDNRVFCCEEEEEEDPHAAPLREGGGVLGDGIISSIFFLCGVFVFRFHQ